MKSNAFLVPLFVFVFMLCFTRGDGLSGEGQSAYKRDKRAAEKLPGMSNEEYGQLMQASKNLTSTERDEWWSKVKEWWGNLWGKMKQAAEKVGQFFTKLFNPNQQQPQMPTGAPRAATPPPPNPNDFIKPRGTEVESSPGVGKVPGAVQEANPGPSAVVGPAGVKGGVDSGSAGGVVVSAVNPSENAVGGANGPSPVQPSSATGGDGMVIKDG